MLDTFLSPFIRLKHLSFWLQEEEEEEAKSFVVVPSVSIPSLAHIHADCSSHYYYTKIDHLTVFPTLKSITCYSLFGHGGPWQSSCAGTDDQPRLKAATHDTIFCHCLVVAQNGGLTLDLEASLGQPSSPGQRQASNKILIREKKESYAKIMSDVLFPHM